jgi:hypothetical protein
MSLGTHQGNETAWHRLVVWSSDQICHRNIRFAGQGDLVKVQAWHEVYRFKADDGTEHEIHQLIAERSGPSSASTSRPRSPGTHGRRPSRGRSPPPPAGPVSPPRAGHAA